MFADTSILVEILAQPATNPRVRAALTAIGQETLFASPIQLGELADAARRGGENIEDVLRRARDLLELVPLDADTAIQASEIKAEARRRPEARALSLIDGIILASARVKGQPLLTFDRAFTGLAGALVI